jgi:hypothetical protein
MASKHSTISALPAARIIKPLAATAWGTKDFYIEDLDGYIIRFGGRPAAG